MQAVDALIQEAGRTHVIPPREDPELLERLRDPQVFARARELLGSGDKRTRDEAILCIERVGYVLHDQVTAEVLLQHAATAKARDEIETTLRSLSHLHPPNPLPAKPLVRLARRSEWQVWQMAVQCLHLAPADEVEPALMERLDADPIGLSYVAVELRHMRSQESLTALKGLLRHDNLDVRCVALDSLGERLGEGVVPLARQLAGGRRREEKWRAEKWLARYGDVEDIPFMISRVKRLLKNGTLTQYHPPELSFIVPFLRSHSSNSAAAAALESIRTGLSKLPENEREWVEQKVPEIL